MGVRDSGLGIGVQAMGVSSYRDLEVWQMGIELVKRVYRLTRELPAEERFALGDQMRRAVVSVPANIAEGWARDHTKEYLRFISIARGSLAELDTFFTLCIELEYVQADRMTQLTEFSDRLGRMLNTLQSSLKTKMR